MSQYAVTHVDEMLVRRRLVLSAANRAAAQAAVERIYGLPWFLTAVRVNGGAR
ncbi:hypothetical protein [Delftia sp. ASV31]|jgi:hypothetical protein|uniref:hypothetical protein n=1 Tax=Delftia sp. ASV31 TaxID=2795113 RepID=UPI0018EAB3EC|nr:hypothetical protein [Delftia sp. ASV31]